MQSVIGVFPDSKSAERALNVLTDSGHKPEDISVIASEEARIKIGTETDTNVVEGTVSGATTGGVIGGLAGLLIGLGAIAIPGIGGLLIGGPLAAALGLTGAAATTVSGAATGALAGGLVGALASLGLPKETAEIYEQRVRSGGVVLAVSTNDVDSVKDVMRNQGAEEIQTIETS
jgi:hypothetical protein